MLLLDIGNTNIKVYDGEDVSRIEAKEEHLPSQPFCYINVNPKLHEVLQQRKDAVDLAGYFAFRTAYEGMGVDRVAACYSVEDGVVVDAGSAITVDIMQNGVHQGGFIMPGIRSYKESFVNISTRLTYDSESEISLDKLPQNTNDALMYAVYKSIVLMIQTHAKGKTIYMTGGDAKQIGKYLDGVKYDEYLVFRGMQKVIKETGISC